MTSRSSLPRPEFDPQLQPAIDVILAGPSTLTLEMIPLMREHGFGPSVDELLRDRPVTHVEMTAPGPDGVELRVSVFRRSDHVAGGPAILHLHGGGMVGGDRFLGADTFLPWAERYDAVVASVEYRLAPEHPDPIPVEDCYAALVWMVSQSAELGFDAARVVVAGMSAGGGLSAGVALMARDRGGPALAGQLLLCPMLDERNDSTSARQFASGTLWDRTSNDTGWDALLGGRRGSDAVSPYASPSRATDLSCLPPTFIDVGSAEVFRDEDVAYASRIWEAGGDAELHVWPGGFHGFQALVPDAAVSQDALAAQIAWLDRTLAPRIPPTNEEHQ